MAADLTIDRAAASDLPEIRELARRASAESGAPVLNEQSLVALAGAAGAPPVVHVAKAEGAIVAAAVVEVADGAPSTAELVLPIGPQIASAGPILLDAVIDDARIPADQPLLLWAHGRRSPSAPLAESRGYQQVRSLWRLRREGDLQVPDAPIPDGVTISTFDPAPGSADRRDWLAVNAAAFATHAEQGRWTEADLQARIDEDWFDPAGFFLARDASGALLGFHWTKVEPPAHDGAAVGDGEVYVIGVSPEAAGLRLGSALLAIGLRHLQTIGAPVVYLYVDGDNTGARALYANRGFVEDDLDVCYRLR
jgi:mycothiol synthase